MWDWYNQFDRIITANMYHNQQRRKSQRDRTFSQNMISLSHTIHHSILRPTDSQVGSEVMMENEDELEDENENENENEKHSHSRHNSFSANSIEPSEVYSDNPPDLRFTLDDDDDDDEYPCEGACM